MEAFLQLLASGELLREVTTSVTRVLIGFSLAGVAGVPLGLTAGSFLLIHRLISPVNSFLRYVPPTAFIALLILYLGIGEAFKYGAIFFGIIFFIVQMVIDVVDGLDAHYLEMARTSGFSNWQAFRHVIVPFALPRITTVLRINLSAAWTFLVAAELIGSDSGLGHLIAVSQRFLRVADLYAAIFTFGLIGLVSDRAFEWTSRRVFRWYYLELKQ